MEKAGDAIGPLVKVVGAPGNASKRAARMVQTLIFAGLLQDLSRLGLQGLDLIGDHLQLATEPPLIIWSA